MIAHRPRDTSLPKVHESRHWQRQTWTLNSLTYLLFRRRNMKHKRYPLVEKDALWVRDLFRHSPALGIPSGNQLWDMLESCFPLSLLVGSNLPEEEKRQGWWRVAWERHWANSWSAWVELQEPGDVWLVQDICFDPEAGWNFVLKIILRFILGSRYTGFIFNMHLLAVVHMNFF